MGLLDQALGGVLGGALGGGRSTGRGRSPIVNALLLALAAKALQHYLSQRRQTQTHAGAPGGIAPTQPPGGVGDILGGLLNGGGGLGGLLGSLGGVGGLGGLLEQFGKRGLTDQSQSWVGPGANQPIEARHIAAALDDDDIDDLVTTTGLPRAQVLEEVAQALPDAIDQLTPNGRLPTDAELEDLTSSYEAQARAGAT